MKNLLVLLAALSTTILMLGCERAQNILNPMNTETVGQTGWWDTEARSTNYSIYSSEGTVYILSVYGYDAVIGDGKLFPQIKTRATFEKGFAGYGLWKGDDSSPPTKEGQFGRALAIHENDLPVQESLIAGGRALLAVGAPEENAVYIFRLGVDGYEKEGVWWEAKITASSLQRMGFKDLPGPGDGFGHSVKFINGYLSINSKSGRIGISIPIQEFLSIG